MADSSSKEAMIQMSVSHVPLNLDRSITLILTLSASELMCNHWTAASFAGLNGKAIMHPQTRVAAFKDYSLTYF